MMYKCRFCEVRLEHESNIRAHANLCHAEIVEQIIYRQYLDYLQNQQALERYTYGSSQYSSF